MKPTSYGKYELIERVARGGMAEIYKARVRGAAGFEKVVAIKKLHPHLSEDSEMVNSLKDEARLVSNMFHPNICQVYDLGQEADSYYIAMEYIYGKDVSTIVRQELKNGSAIPLDVSLYIIRQTLAGMDYAHRMADPSTGTPLNIIHRDISPQNIIVSYSGAVKIIDFGIAKAAESIHHTQAGVIKGKFKYMAPEHAQGKPIDHRIDIFAVGVMLYEFMLGESHSKGASEAELIVKAQLANFQPIDELVADLPFGLADAISKALSGNPDNRFPSARVFNGVLENIVKNEGLDITAEAVGAYLNGLFPNPYSQGSRVDEIELLSGEFQELSPVPAEKQEFGSIQNSSRSSSRSSRRSSRRSSGGSSRPASRSASRSASRPASRPEPKKDEFLPLYQPEIADFSSPAPPKEEVVEKELPVVLPAGNSRATGDRGRNRRKAARDNKRVEEDKRVEEAHTFDVEKAKKDKERMTKIPGKPMLGPFFKRLKNAFQNAITNVIILVVLFVLGVFGLNHLNSKKQNKPPGDNNQFNKIKKVNASCNKGAIKLSIKSDPTGAKIFIDSKDINKTTPLSNYEMKMCYDKPLLIRLEKGNASIEKKVNYPVDGDKISLTFKLVKEDNIGDPDDTDDLDDLDDLDDVDKSPKTMKSGVMNRTMAVMKNITNKKVDMKTPELTMNKLMATNVKLPDEEDKSGMASDGTERGGQNIGILKISCSEKCSISINGRIKGTKRKSFSLRAIKKPYWIKATFTDGRFRRKKVYIYPSQKNFVRFSR
jgi:serine/threonine protein kinase